MSDRISTADVVHVAKLARLALTEQEIERTTAQLGDMLEHFADIERLDLADVAPMTQPYPNSVGEPFGSLFAANASRSVSGFRSWRVYNAASQRARSSTDDANEPAE